MHVLSFAKGALAMFWLVAILNVIYPFGEPLHRPLLLVAGVMLVAHVAEAALFNRKLKARPFPGWTAPRCCCSASCTCAGCADPSPRGPGLKPGLRLGAPGGTCPIDAGTVLGAA